MVPWAIYISLTPRHNSWSHSTAVMVRVSVSCSDPEVWMWIMHQDVGIHPINNIACSSRRRLLHKGLPDSPISLFYQLLWYHSVVNLPSLLTYMAFFDLNLNDTFGAYTLGTFASSMSVFFPFNALGTRLECTVLTDYLEWLASRYVFKFNFWYFPFRSWLIECTRRPITTLIRIPMDCFSSWL